MRNWMLTPLIVIGLAGAGFDFRNPRDGATTSVVDEDGCTVLVGARLALRQLGPLRPGDQDVAVALRHHGGPRPDGLRAWISDHGGVASNPVPVPVAGSFGVLDVPTPAVWRRPRLWLEAHRGGASGRAAFALES